MIRIKYCYFVLARTFERDTNVGIVRSKVFLNDAGGLHRFDRQIAHHHAIVQFPHDYERVTREFQHVTAMGQYFLYHRTDITVQRFR